IAGAAAAGGIALDPHEVTRGIGLRDGQRILAHEAVRQVNIDVRAGLEGRKRAAVGTSELVGIRVARYRLDGRYSAIDQISGRLARLRLGRGQGAQTRPSALRLPPEVITPDRVATCMRAGRSWCPKNRDSRCGTTG